MIFFLCSFISLMDKRFEAVVIGAGLSGLVAGQRAFLPGRLQLAVLAKKLAAGGVLNHELELNHESD